MATLQSGSLNPAKGPFHLRGSNSGSIALLSFDCTNEALQQAYQALQGRPFILYKAPGDAQPVNQIIDRSTASHKTCSVTTPSVFWADMTSRNAQAPTAKPSARRIVPAIPHKFARPRPQDTKPKGTLVDRVETVKEKEKAPAQEDESEKRALAPQEESKDESKKEVATSKDVSNKEVATSKDDGSTKEVAASKDEPKKKVTSKQTVVTPPQSMDRADAEQKHAAANGHVAESQPVPEGHAETEPLGAAKLHQPEGTSVALPSCRINPIR